MKLDISFAPISYNMHKASIIKVIKVITISIMINITISNILYPMTSIKQNILRDDSNGQAVTHIRVSRQFESVYTL
jgi:hypothetical protein